MPDRDGRRQEQPPGCRAVFFGFFECREEGAGECSILPGSGPVAPPRPVRDGAEGSGRRNRGAMEPTFRSNLCAAIRHNSKFPQPRLPLPGVQWNLDGCTHRATWHLAESESRYDETTDTAPEMARPMGMISWRVIRRRVRAHKALMWMEEGCLTTQTCTLSILLIRSLAVARLIGRCPGLLLGPSMQLSFGVDISGRPRDVPGSSEEDRTIALGGTVP